jgi:hypothetical protein
MLEELILKTRLDLLICDIKMEGLRLMVKYDANQPRVPAGNPDGGQWTDGGGGGGGGTPKPNTRKPSINHSPRNLSIRKAPDFSSHKRATAIYGETSGLTPRLIDKNKSAYDKNNWNSASEDNLFLARTYIGIVSDRNPRVHYAEVVDKTNPIEVNTWNRVMDSAISGNVPERLNSKVNHFFIRQEGVGKQNPPWPELIRYGSMGPFNNVGGGDVPKGTDTYIDFYGKK